MRRTLSVLLGVGLLTGACSSAGNGGGGGAGGDDDAAAGGRDTRPADCAPARPAEGTSGPQTLDVEGQTREYLLAVPEGYDGSTAVPLVLNFHGATNTKEGQEAYTRMAELATDRGYVVATPDGSGEPQDWNFFADPARPDDFGFVDALVEDLRERLCIDGRSVYATGHSAGSALTGFLVCDQPDRFAAVAMVAAFVPRTCPVGEDVPAVMAIHGSADPVVPYEGGSVGGSSTGVPPALDTLTGYGEVYGCPEPLAEDDPVPGMVERRRFAGCEHGDEVVLYTVVGGGHEWPNDQRFSATEAILDFFDEH
jgi:polyhydroxybutyrate depolymerase